MKLNNKNLITHLVIINIIISCILLTNTNCYSKLSSLNNKFSINKSSLSMLKRVKPRTELEYLPGLSFALPSTEFESILNKVREEVLGKIPKNRKARKSFKPSDQQTLEDKKIEKKMFKILSWGYTKVKFIKKNGSFPIIRLKIRNFSFNIDYSENHGRSFNNWHFDIDIEIKDKKYDYTEFEDANVYWGLDLGVTINNKKIDDTPKIEEKKNEEEEEEMSEEQLGYFATMMDYVAKTKDYVVSTVGYAVQTVKNAPYNLYACTFDYIKDWGIYSVTKVLQGLSNHFSGSALYNLYNLPSLGENRGLNLSLVKSPTIEGKSLVMHLDFNPVNINIEKTNKNGKKEKLETNIYTPFQLNKQDNHGNNIVYNNQLDTDGDYLSVAINRRVLDRVVKSFLNYNFPLMHLYKNDKNTIIEEKHRMYDAVDRLIDFERNTKSLSISFNPIFIRGNETIKKTSKKSKMTSTEQSNLISQYNNSGILIGLNLDYLNLYINKVKKPILELLFNQDETNTNLADTNDDDGDDGDALPEDTEETVAFAIQKVQEFKLSYKGEEKKGGKVIGILLDLELSDFWFSYGERKFKRWNVKLTILIKDLVKFVSAENKSVTYPNIELKSINASHRVRFSHKGIKDMLKKVGMKISSKVTNFFKNMINRNFVKTPIKDLFYNLVHGENNGFGNIKFNLNFTAPFRVFDNNVLVFGINGNVSSVKHPNKYVTDYKPINRALFDIYFDKFVSTVSNGKLINISIRNQILEKISFEFVQLLIPGVDIKGTTASIDGRVPPSLQFVKDEFLKANVHIHNIDIKELLDAYSVPEATK